MLLGFFFSSRRRHTSCALVTGVQTCALPISTPDPTPPHVSPTASAPVRAGARPPRRAERHGGRLVMPAADAHHLDRPIDPSDHALGSAQAGISLVEYGSYACPHCRAANRVIADLPDRFGDRKSRVEGKGETDSVNAG